jgi:ribA/ribD-fused uncharacterized protein
MSNQIAKYRNLLYLCDDCVSSDVIPTFRRFANKLYERAVTLGKLLDVYDAKTNQPMQSPNSTQATSPQPQQTIPTPNDVTQPTTSAANSDDVTIILEKNGRENSAPEPEPVIVKGQHDPRSNFYRFDFTYGHVKYKSLEHAYQSIKATMCGYAALAWDIRKARSPQVAKSLADKLPRLAMKELHDLMFDLLKAKVSQCYSFRRSLRSTGSRKIFHSTYRNVDTYWCTGLDHRDIEGHRGEYEGLNVFGQMLEKIRDEHLLGEENYETRIQCLEADNYVVILHDGEESFVHDQVFRYRGSGYRRYNH